MGGTSSAIVTPDKAPCKHRLVENRATTLAKKFVQRGERKVSVSFDEETIERVRLTSDPLDFAFFTCLPFKEMELKTKVTRLLGLSTLAKACTRGFRVSHCFFSLPFLKLPACWNSEEYGSFVYALFLFGTLLGHFSLSF